MNTTRYKVIFQNENVPDAIIHAFSPYEAAIRGMAMAMLNGQDYPIKAIVDTRSGVEYWYVPGDIQEAS